MAASSFVIGNLEQSFSNVSAVDPAWLAFLLTMACCLFNTSFVLSIIALSRGQPDLEGMFVLIGSSR